jgi:hypothetical protein
MLAYRGLIDSLRKSSEFARAIGLKRGDMRWIKVRGMLDQCADNCTKLFNKAQNGTGTQH